MTKKRGRGRPPKAKADKQDQRVSAYFTRAEAEVIKAECARASIPPSAYLVTIWRERRMVREK